MAKSTGNIARVGELLDAGVSPRALRYALIAVHYRAPLDYSDESLGRGRRGPRAAGPAASPPSRRTARTAPDDARSRGAPAWPATAFGAALDDDLNVSGGARGGVRPGPRANRRIEARSLSTADAERALPRCATSTRCSASCRPPTTASTDLAALLAERAAARAARDWAASDRLRDELAARGVAGRGHARRPALARAGEAGRG